MSFDINVFIEKDRMLSRDEWQGKIEQAGFPVKLYPTFDTKEMSGMLPCTLGDIDAGFEYYFDLLEDTMFNPSTDETLANRLQGRNVCVGFSIAAGLKEESKQAAIMAAAVLANAIDGILWIDPDFVDTDSPIEWVKNQMGGGTDDFNY